MKRPTLYVVFGKSGAGKDTVGDWLTENKGTTGIKFAAPGKRALEFMMQIPEGSMDDRVFRSQVAPFMQGRTYLEVLVDFWKHRELVIGDELFTAQTYSKLLELSSNSKDVCITDARNLEEGEAIWKLVEAGCFSLELMLVSRGKSKRLASDIHQLDILNTLMPICDSYTHLDNNADISALHYQLKQAY